MKKRTPRCLRQKHGASQSLVYERFFLLGTKAGEAIRTVANIHKLLSGQAEIAVFTQNCNFGPGGLFKMIVANKWLKAEDDYARSYAANNDTKKQNIAMFQNAVSYGR